MLSLFVVCLLFILPPLIFFISLAFGFPSPLHLLVDRLESRMYLLEFFHVLVKAVIHIGAHKTATTSFQLFLNSNRDQLKQIGIYFHPGDPGNHRIAHEFFVVITIVFGTLSPMLFRS